MIGPGSDKKDEAPYLYYVSRHFLRLYIYFLVLRKLMFAIYKCTKSLYYSYRLFIGSGLSLRSACQPLQDEEKKRTTASNKSIGLHFYHEKNVQKRIFVEKIGIIYEHKKIID